MIFLPAPEFMPGKQSNGKIIHAIIPEQPRKTVVILKKVYSLSQLHREIIQVVFLWDFQSCCNPEFYLNEEFGLSPFAE